jgi:hypothetical protein
VSGAKRVWGDESGNSLDHAAKVPPAQTLACACSSHGWSADWTEDWTTAWTTGTARWSRRRDPRFRTGQMPTQVTNAVVGLPYC